MALIVALVLNLDLVGALAPILAFIGDPVGWLKLGLWLRLVRGYFVLHAVCSACRFDVNGEFILFSWVNGNFILFFLGECEF